MPQSAGRRLNRAFSNSGGAPRCLGTIGHGFHRPVLPVHAHPDAKLVASAGQTLDDLRPRVVEISSDCAAIARSGREQVERLESLLNDVSDRARERIDQIDRSVDNTVEQVEQVGEAVKRAALRPVREVNGLAAGISAAFSTLVHGMPRSSVDHATQDEEMFI